MTETFDPRELPPPFREWLATFEAMRRLGFQSDNIVLATDLSGLVQLQLQTQGLEFRVDCGVLSPALRGQPALDIWRQVCGAMGSIDGDHLQEVWDGSWIASNGAALVTRLMAKGFRLPCAGPRGLPN